jgi:hypothetical protein
MHRVGDGARTATLKKEAGRVLLLRPGRPAAALRTNMAGRKRATGRPFMAAGRPAGPDLSRKTS